MEWGTCACGGTIKQLSGSPMWQCERCAFGFTQLERMGEYRSMTVQQGFRAKWHLYEQEARQESD
jgi:hypothetical protein